MQTVEQLYFEYFWGTVGDRGEFFFFFFSPCLLNPIIEFTLFLLFLKIFSGDLACRMKGSLLFYCFRIVPPPSLYINFHVQNYYYYIYIYIYILYIYIYIYIYTHTHTPIWALFQILCAFFVGRITFRHRNDKRTLDQLVEVLILC